MLVQEPCHPLLSQTFQTNVTDCLLAVSWPKITVSRIISIQMTHCQPLPTLACLLLRPRLHIMLYSVRECHITWWVERKCGGSVRHFQQADTDRNLRLPSVGHERNYCLCHVVDLYSDFVTGKIFTLGRLLLSVGATAQHESNQLYTTNEFKHF